MTRRIFSCLCLGIYVWLAMLSGCSSQQAYNKKYYMLSATREKESIKDENDGILEVRHFTIDSAFSDKGLVYRIGEFEYETDFYNEFLVSPSAMITEKARTWLSESGLFKRVLDSGSQVDSTHLIEANITELYGDFRDKSSPRAVMEIRIFLLKINPGKDPFFVHGKTYISTVGVDSKSPEGLVNALGQCLEEILSSLEKDLVGKLS
ncbi:MAG: membrane integrity-associated transporter subunit PqiC [Planctomycetes bacterium]|nr:membrane integrity-associated transporter subunit PqiC [Planctomycetota bacterium]MBL7142908.1 membrane integrity-associated transporter subunit PqiC [Phycisphaerae bacterium]